MRPLKLSLKGFRSHRTGTVIDFRGRGLVGVVGPIGSGKSSILDGISFALFAQTPAGGAQTKSLIHQQAVSAHVEFWFESGDQTWRVVRALRRKGQAAHTLARFDDMESSESLESYELKSDVDAKVQDLLGMEFPAFSRSIMLAQGRFAQLLQATPTEANKVLQSVFGFDQIPRMRDAANTRVTKAQATIDALGSEARRLQVARSDLAEAQVSALASGERAELFSGLRTQFDVALSDQQQATKSHADLQDAHAVVERAVSALPPDTRAVLEAETSRSVRVAEAAMAVELALKHLEAAITDRDRLQEAGVEANLSVARLLVEQHRAVAAGIAGCELQMATAQAVLQQRTAAHSSEQEGLTRAAGAYEHSLLAEKAAELRLVDARTAVEAGRRVSAAHDLRGHLAVGEPCPVCDQSVPVIPGVGDDSILTSLEVTFTDVQAALHVAKAEAVRAGATFDVAKQSASELEKQVEVAQADLTGVTERQENLTDQRATLDSKLTGVLGEGEHSLLITALTQEWEAVVANHEAAAAAHTSADEALSEVKAAGLEGQQRFEQLRQAVLLVSDRLNLPPPALNQLHDVETGWDTIVAAADTKMSEIAIQQEGLSEKMAAAVSSLSSVLQTAEVATPQAFEEASLNARSEASRLTTTVEVMEKALREGGDIAERLAGAESELEVYQKLTKDLNPSRFLAFMLDEERATLVSVSAHKLAELSGGRYGFDLSDKGEIEMIDNTAAEYRRAPSSLSGGETFLASLALALGLAEMVAGGVGTLDAFFLDEGFGSLDAEHLDLAMEGIEQLVATGNDRLVVVVSHVAELSERVEDLIVLDRHPDTGASVLLSGGTLEA